MKIDEIKAEFIRRLEALPIHEPQTVPPGQFALQNVADDLDKLDQHLGWFVNQIETWAEGLGGLKPNNFLTNSGSGLLSDAAYGLREAARDIYETQAETEADFRNDQRAG